MSSEIKWSAFPIVSAPTTGDTIVGLRSGGNVQFAAPSFVQNQSWTPTFTFTTPGNLSVVYTTQTATYTRIGSIVFFTFLITFTPTFTTSSGAINITGLPFSANASITSFGTLLTSGLTYAGQSYTAMDIAAGTNYILPVAAGSGTNTSTLMTTNISSGVSNSFYGTGFYFV